MPEFDFEKEENRRLLAKLYAYARGLFGKLNKTDTSWRGNGFRDYVHDAILKHINGEDNYDPNKGPLEYHLKYNVIRQAITNDVDPSVKKEYAEWRKKTLQEREMNQKTAIAEVAITPDEIGMQTMIINNVDNDQLFKEIEAEMKDEVVKLIYLAVVQDKYHFSERAEICEDFDISNEDFDKGKRRLLTILRRVFKKLNIKP